MPFATPPEPSANPLAIVRSLPTQLIPIDQIKVPEGLPKDDIFLARYQSFLSGRTPIHETRVPLASIRRGFWDKVNGSWKLMDWEVNPDHLEAAIRMVRLGTRPVLHLYESPNPADSFRFVCTDDTVVHAAYERLGISRVPVALMAKPRDLEDSCISIRNFPRGRGKHISLIDGFVPVTSSLVPSVLGHYKPNLSEAFERLLSALAATKSLVRAFHVPGSEILHYHHTLYSVLLRAEECIDAMRQLVDSGKPLTAAALLRSLHELALVFYVDWLAPGQTYRYLQLASVMSETQWLEECERGRREDIASGATLVEAKNIRDAHMRGFRLGCVVGERARLFPLGDDFQRGIYHLLSDVIHHDFSMTARYAFTLDHGDESIYHEDLTRSIIHVSDVLVGSIVSRVLDDIGQQKPALSSDG